MAFYQTKYKSVRTVPEPGNCTTITNTSKYKMKTFQEYVELELDDLRFIFRKLKVDSRLAKEAEEAFVNALNSSELAR